MFMFKLQLYGNDSMFYPMGDDKFTQHTLYTHWP